MLKTGLRRHPVETSQPPNGTYVEKARKYSQKIEENLYNTLIIRGQQAD